MIYLFCIYMANRMRKKKPRDIGAADNKILRLSKRGNRLKTKRAVISTAQKPPSSDLH